MCLETYFLNLSLVGQNWYVGKFQRNPWSKQREEDKPADNTLLLQVDIFSVDDTCVTTAGHHIPYCLYSALKANYTFQKWSKIAQLATIPGLVTKCAVLSGHGSYQGLLFKEVLHTCLVWFWCAASVIAAFTPAQMNRTKGENTSVIRSN